MNAEWPELVTITSRVIDNASRIEGPEGFDIKTFRNKTQSTGSGFSGILCHLNRS